MTNRRKALGWGTAALLGAILGALAPGLRPVAAGAPGREEGKGAAGTAGRIVVGPNVRVSLDGDVGHMELDFAAHPTDPNQLCGGAVVLAGPGQKSICKTYASADGGQTWSDSLFGHVQLTRGSQVDPQIAAGPNGAFYFLSIGLPLHRSTDGGMTWTAIGRPKAGDHPQLSADHSQGPHRGRLYLSTGAYYVQGIDDRPDVAVVQDSVVLAKPGGLSYKPQVFSDGTLFVPLVGWEKLQPTGYRALSSFCLSGDGGKTLGERTTIFEHPYHGFKQPTSLGNAFIVRDPNSLQFATDLHVRRDRLYFAWSDTRLGELPRVFLAASDDRGKSWSAPVAVDAALPADAAQWNPMLAVNREGTVAVAWLDTRDDPTRETFNVYFAASLDGGKSFLPTRRLSSQPSRPHGAGNNRLWLHIQSVEKDGSRRLMLESAYRRWPTGGDYLAMAAGADGVFHPFWPDARDGTYQVATARVRVLPEGRALPTVPADLQEVDLSRDVELRCDYPRFDAATSEAAFPIRLRNIGTKPVYGPLRVEVASTKHLQPLDTGPRIDYSDLLGDAGALPPGGVTDARVWRFRHTGIQQVPEFVVKITGRVAAAPAATP